MALFVFSCMMPVLYKYWCHGTVWTSHWRYWYTSQIQYRPQVIKSDTEAQQKDMQEPHRPANTGTTSERLFYSVRSQLYLPWNMAIIRSWKLKLPHGLTHELAAVFHRCYNSIFLRPDMSVALRYSPRFLRLLFLTYQSDRYNSSSAADWNRLQINL